MFTCVHMWMLPIQIHSLLYVNCHSHPVWPGKENMRGNLCHVSQAVRRHSTEEDLRDANEKRWQHRRRLQDNVLNRNDRPWVQIGWQRKRYMEGKAERCWHGRMVYNFLKLTCSFFKSFTACLPWLSLLIRHPDSPIIMQAMYFSDQMVLAGILKAT